MSATRTIPKLIGLPIKSFFMVIFEIVPLKNARHAECQIKREDYGVLESPLTYMVMKSLKKTRMCAEALLDPTLRSKTGENVEVPTASEES